MDFLGIFCIEKWNKLIWEYKNFDQRSQFKTWGELKPGLILKLKNRQSLIIFIITSLRIDVRSSDVLVF